MVAGEVATRPQVNSDAEIIALFPRPKCPKPPEFPMANSLGLYGTLAEFGPFVCGLHFSEMENSCFAYKVKELEWISMGFAINEKRTHASSAHFNNRSWIIIGGQKYLGDVPVVLDSSEVFNGSMFNFGPKLPIPLSGHCSVKLNKSHIFVAGGYGTPHLKEVFLLHSQRQALWENLTSMQLGKFGHSCGKVVTLFDHVEVVAAGGLHQDSIEIYSTKSSAWSTGPKIENRQIFKAATLQGKTAFIITGGVEIEPDCTMRNCRLDSIFTYDTNTNNFKKNDVDLSQGRGYHVAIPLPTFIDCSSKDFHYIYNVLNN